ncbi:hypothetical protein Tco_0132905 [Tanacetum coccineum]
MSNTNNNNMQTQTSSALHNVIMEAGGKDRPPMYFTTTTTKGEVMETFATVPEDIQKWITVEAEVVQIILTGIDNDIYSTVDACPNAIKMWKAIERLKQVYYSQTHPTHYTQSSSTRSQAATENRGKAIVNAPKPTYYPELEVVADDDASIKEKEIDKLMDLISMSFKKIYKPSNNNLRTSSNTKNMNVDNTSRTNRGTGYDRQSGQYDNQRAINIVRARENVARECQKLKRAKDSAYHKEKMLMCKQEEAGIQLSAEQVDWRDDTDDELEDQELEAHYIDDDYNVFANERQHPEQPGSVNDKYLMEQGDTNITHDSSDMSNNGEEADQDDQMLQKERELLASLIEQIKIGIDASKQNNKDLESSNKALKEANMFLQSELTSFAKPVYLKKAQSMNPHLYAIGCYNDNLALMLAPKSDDTICLAQEIRSKLISPQIKAVIEQKLHPTAKRLSTVVSDFYHALKQEMFSNEIDPLSREYYSDDHMNAILDVYTKLDEVTNLQCDYLEALEKCQCLKNELSKRNTTSKSFEALQQHAINLEIALQQCQKHNKNDKAWKQKESSSFQELNDKFFKIQDLKAQLQDKNIAISELKKLIDKMKEKSMETKFDKSSVIRQPNAFKCQKQSLLGKPNTFLDSLEKKDVLKSRSVTINNMSKDFSKPVTAQILPQKENQVQKNINVIATGITKKPIAVPISTSEPKGIVNQSVATPHKKSVASESTIQKSKSTFRKLYEYVSKTCSWWYPKITPPGYKWEPKSKLRNVNRNLKLLVNFVEKFLRTVKFGNDQFAPILGYGDLVQGNITIKRVYCVEGLNHNLFCVGQFYDADLEVAFRKSTCYVRDLKGNDLLTGSHGTDLYYIISSMVMASFSFPSELRYYQLAFEE